MAHTYRTISLLFGSKTLIIHGTEAESKGNDLWWSGTISSSVLFIFRTLYSWNGTASSFHFGLILLLTACQRRRNSSLGTVHESQSELSSFPESPRCPLCPKIEDLKRQETQSLPSLHAVCRARRGLSLMVVARRQCSVWLHANRARHDITKWERWVIESSHKHVSLKYSNDLCRITKVYFNAREMITNGIRTFIHLYLHYKCQNLWIYCILCKLEAPYSISFGSRLINC